MVWAEKREKGQDIAGEEKRGSILKRVKRTEGEKREGEAGGEEKKEQKYLQ